MLCVIAGSSLPLSSLRRLWGSGPRLPRHLSGRGGPAVTCPAAGSADRAARLSRGRRLAQSSETPLPQSGQQTAYGSGCRGRQLLYSTPCTLRSTRRRLLMPHVDCIRLVEESCYLSPFPRLYVPVFRPLWIGTHCMFSYPQCPFRKKLCLYN